jgi:hypothetical protein
MKEIREIFRIRGDVYKAWVSNIKNAEQLGE